jgi:hypothetical protein
VALGDGDTFLTEDCHLLGRLYRKHQFSSSVMIFQRKPRSLSAVLICYRLVITLFLQDFSLCEVLLVDVIHLQILAENGVATTKKNSLSAIICTV